METNTALNGKTTSGSRIKTKTELEKTQKITIGVKGLDFDTPNHQRLPRGNRGLEVLTLTQGPNITDTASEADTNNQLRPNTTETNMNYTLIKR